MHVLQLVEKNTMLKDITTFSKLVILQINKDTTKVTPRPFFPPFFWIIKRAEMTYFFVSFCYFEKLLRQKICRPAVFTSSNIVARKKLSHRRLLMLKDAAIITKKGLNNVRT